jgi:hypothetical protein
MFHVDRMNTSGVKVTNLYMMEGGKHDQVQGFPSNATLVQ